jgi:MoxR-like ATPase
MSTAQPAATPEVGRAPFLDRVIAQVHRRVVGQEYMIERLLIGLLTGGHVLFEGLPGLAKTLAVRTLAATIDAAFQRIQFTPDLLPADVVGTTIYNARTAEFVPHRGPIFAHIVLADEVNRAPAKTQSALLEAMQELAVTVNGKTYPLAPPFIVVATQNPIEQEGTYPLPEAQLDRFMLSIHVGYPSRADETGIAAMPIRAKKNSFTPLALKEDFQRFTEIVDEMPVSRHVLEAAVALTTASRPSDSTASEYTRRYVAWGAGPRATQHLITAAKACALLDGRPTPETRDLHRMALPVLRHRIIPNYNALGEGIESDAIVKHLLESVREPAMAK